MDWSAATTLGERRRLWRPELAPLHRHHDPAAAEFRERAWRSMPAFGDEAVFCRRLATDQVESLAAFRELLHTSPAALTDSAAAPAWAQQIESAYRSAATVSGSHTPSAVMSQPDGPAGRPEPWEAAIATLADPVVAQARAAAFAVLARQWQSRTEMHAWRWRESAARIALADPPARLARMLTGVFALELHVARMAAPPDAAPGFWEFLETLRSPAQGLALLDRYPVLGRWIAGTVASWQQSTVELLGRLFADDRPLAALLGHAASQADLAGVHYGLGDWHCGGRSVARLDFADGTRVIYRPRPAEVYQHFHELLGWIASRDAALRLRSPAVVARPGYGWAEYLHPRPCRADERPERFFFRAGALAALLHVLGGRDFHAENLLACGDMPVPVDLETLFSPRLATGGPGEERLALLAQRESVLALDLLPMPILQGEHGQGIDLSALGDRPGQLTPYAVPVWEGGGTEEIRLRTERLESTGAANACRLPNGQVARLSDYTEALADGFTRMYELLQAHRDELADRNGPLRAFDRDPVRVLFRDTATYVTLLLESLHPDLLRDGVDRDRHLDNLWADVATRPGLERVVAAEHADLQDGDVPYFETTVGSRELRDSRACAIPAVIAASGSEVAASRLRGLSPADRDRQLWTLRGAVRTWELNQLDGLPAEAADTGPELARAAPGHASAGLSADELLHAALRLGERLAALAYRAGHQGATWFGIASTGGYDWRVEPVGDELYAGNAGIALFLAELGAATGEQRFTRLARQALVPVWRQADERAGAGTAGAEVSVGGFAGLGGLLYVAACLARLWDDQALWTRAHQLTAAIVTALPGDRAYDVVGGAAGAVLAILSTLSGPACPGTSASTAIEAALAGGHHLLRSAVRAGSGIGWRSSLTADVPLTGFAHGGAGIALALRSLHHVTGEVAFRQAAADAEAWERDNYVPAAQNWRDLRRRDALRDLPADLPAEELRCATAWCHGATGIGLGRALALRLIPGTGSATGKDRGASELREDLSRAVATALRSGVGNNHSLCHGDLGVAELCYQATTFAGDGPSASRGDWHLDASRIAADVATELRARAPRCGTPNTLETPGLMTGLAGIGYGLLRAARPQTVPCVLGLLP